MFENYYLQQLTNLRKKAAQFAQVHPAIAPLLRDNSIDPDVERLLEGSAFLNAILHEKLDDDLPELIRGISEILFPHLLRPLPSACIVAFTPKEALLNTITVHSGTLISSVPVEGTSCQFRTTMDIDISPLQVVDVKYERNSIKEDIYTVKLHLNGISLSEWKCQELTFFAGGDFIEATQFFMQIRTVLKRIIVKSESKSFVLRPEALSAPGFQSESLIFANQNQHFCRYSLLTEYFMFPEKFLFYKVSSLNQLCHFEKLNDFELQFVVASQKEQMSICKEMFTLYAVPVVNLFPLEAEPILVDHTIEKMPIIPSCRYRQHYDIYTIDSVTGFVQGTVERKSYAPYNKFKKMDTKDGFFQIHHSRSMVHNTHEVGISLCYEEPPSLSKEVLSIDLTCTNAHLPTRLKTGDISIPTSQSPELATFGNITAPTDQVDVILEKNELWRLLSYFSTNLLPLNNEDSLRELFRKYTFQNQRSDAVVRNNLKKIEGIEKFSTQPVERIIGGILMRGILMKITFDETRFSSIGDAYLFLSVLDNFLSLYTSVNTFTQMESHNSKTGEISEWQPRIGQKALV